MDNDRIRAAARVYSETRRRELSARLSVAYRDSTSLGEIISRLGVAARDVAAPLSKVMDVLRSIPELSNEEKDTRHE